VNDHVIDSISNPGNNGGVSRGGQAETAEWLERYRWNGENRQKVHCCLPSVGGKASSTQWGTRVRVIWVKVKDHHNRSGALDSERNEDGTEGGPVN